MKELRHISWAAALIAVAGTAGAGPQPCAEPAANCQLPDQLGHGSADAIGAVSDASPDAGFVVQENFIVDDGGTVGSVCWWGFYLNFLDQADCGPGGVPDVFTITYFENVQDIPPSPGAVKAGPFDVTATVVKAETGNLIPSAFGDLAEFAFTATHPDVIVEPGECLWIQIANDTAGSDPPCVWLWSTAPSLGEGGVGDGLSWQSGTQHDFDFAFCVSAPLGDPVQCELPIDPGCKGALNPCDQTSPEPGCDDPECCTMVCLQLPFCCLSEWDQQCVDAAADLCTQCGEAGTGDCFVANFTPFCDDNCNGMACIGCCQFVCDFDPFCCDTAWDGFCSSHAQNLCTCQPGQEPANDECENAVAIGVGDTFFVNACATAGGPSHATCNDGFLVGMGLDIWYTHTAEFTGDLLVSTCNQADYDTQLAVYEGCDCDALSDPPLGCNNDGAVCGGGTSLVVVPVTAGTCYTIRVGSSFVDPSGTGTLTLSADIPAPCDITIPPEALEEKEACGDDINGGCNNDPGLETFTPVQLGDVVHGLAWANGGLRDTDWYELDIVAETEVTLTIEAEFPFVMGYAQTGTPGSGECGDATGLVEPFVDGVACETASLTSVLTPGTWWPFVAPSVGDGVPCPAGPGAGNDYVLAIKTGPPPCPWDCAGDDGEVGINDFLALIAQWGTAGSCDTDGDGAVDIDDFLALLANWGLCP